MSNASLTTSSFIVLGFLKQFGPMTPYDLKRCADQSVGYFWIFSRAQLYKEPARLCELGLLTQSKESSGRKRRIYAISAQGEAQLQQWLQERTEVPTEVRDIGLLKLYFAGTLQRTDISSLASDQLAAHSDRLRDYERLIETLGQDPSAKGSLRTLDFGLRFEKLAIAFWEEVVESEKGE